jgi:holin-like protein
MPIVTGLLVLLLFQCAGEALKGYFSIPLPGPVLGMFLLFICLCLYRSVPLVVDKASQTLIPFLALMFLPAAAGLFFLGTGFNNQWPAVLGAVILGALLSLLFNGLMMKWLCKTKSKTPSHTSISNKS